LLGNARRANALLGDALLTARLEAALRAVKAAAHKPKSSVRDVLLRSFQLVRAAVPAIREIGVWAVEDGADGDGIPKLLLADTGTGAGAGKMTMLSMLGFYRGRTAEDNTAVTVVRRRAGPSASSAKIVCGSFVEGVATAAAAVTVAEVRGGSAQAQQVPRWVLGEPLVSQRRGSGLQGGAHSTAAAEAEQEAQEAAEASEARAMVHAEIMR
jgi:hypothetical protein